MTSIFCHQTQTTDIMADWDTAFDNMGHVAGSAALPAHWAAEASTYRASGIKVEEDIAYAEAPRARLDIVWPDARAKGLVVFVHGGYWMRLDKSYWTQFAEGVRKAGWAMALPSYTLAPEARIGAMTAQISTAVTCAGGRVAGPIRLAGHSAGGHLVTRMLCQDTPLAPDILGRIDKVVSISGLHDLRPLLNTKMNTILGLDEAEAVAESPALASPLPLSHVTAWVGGGERPEFIRQARLLSLIWSGLDCDIDLEIDAEHNHFTILESLKCADSPLVTALLR